MEITCSADVPVYHLVDQEGEYDSYNDFPRMFDTEARLSPIEDSVTLYINGLPSRSNNVTAIYINGLTSRSNNVTAICRNFDESPGTSFSTLFILNLEFVVILSL